jgi:hypothetical protein
MGNRFTYLISFVLLVSLGSCATYPTITSPPSAISSGPRTLVLDGDSISQEDVGGFKCWYCKDLYNGGDILVEVGFFGDPIWEGFGFILYDGGYSGESTQYQRKGLEHRWDWGPNGIDYSFVIKTDGTGSYYDFSSVPKGESTKPRAMYKCNQR